MDTKKQSTLHSGSKKYYKGTPMKKILIGLLFTTISNQTFSMHLRFQTVPSKVLLQAFEDENSRTEALQKNDLNADEIHDLQEQLQDMENHLRDTLNEKKKVAEELLFKKVQVSLLTKKNSKLNEQFRYRETALKDSIKAAEAKTHQLHKKDLFYSTGSIHTAIKEAHNTFKFRAKSSGKLNGIFGIQLVYNQMHNTNKKHVAEIYN